MTEVTDASPAAAGAAIGARSRPVGARQGMDYRPPVRTDAFRVAGRHTARVKFLKRAIVVGAGLGVTSIAIVALFNPFRHLPGNISLSGVGVQGTKVTIDSPKISGVQQGGGEYEIKAKTGIQDITTPSIVGLLGVDAKIGMADKTTTHVLSNQGKYDSRKDLMTLTGEVKIANTSGYTLNMQSALMNFRTGVFSSNERLRVDLKGGTVSADEMTISNNGHVIGFRGNIASSFNPPDEPETSVAETEDSRRAALSEDSGR